MAEQLKDTISNYSKNPKESFRNVTYLYNPSDSLLNDIHEAALQKAAERAASVTDTFIAFGMTALGYAGLVSDADSALVRQKVNALITSKLPPQTISLVSQFSDQVHREALNFDVQAILVAHSQGNLFANAVFDGLKASLPANRFRGLGVVNVASPAHIAPSGLWVTAHQDLVIQSLNVGDGVNLTPIPVNFDAGIGATLQAGGHGFTEVYLSDALPAGADASHSIAAFLVKKVDTALKNTSTFYDSPSWIFDSHGNKIPKPPGYPADSSIVTVCFPGPVGGEI